MARAQGERLVLRDRRRLSRRGRTTGSSRRPHRRRAPRTSRATPGGAARDLPRRSVRRQAAGGEPDRGQRMTAPVSVLDLFETHLLVRDLDRSVAFYRDVVGLAPALEEPPRGAAFLWIGQPGEAMLGLWSLGSAPLGVASHVAFKASLEDVIAACMRLRSMNVTPLSFFAIETDEPSVIAWMPAAAVYFHDPDGHLLE